MDLLVKKIKEIEIPDDMRKRIVENCNEEIKKSVFNKKMQEKERSTMRATRKENNFWKKQLSMAAALLLCICITGVTALAATGKLEGFFKDAKNWNEAIVGTSYEQATEEITVSVEEAGEELSVLITIQNPEKPPYRESELFRIGSYRIEDMSGKIMVRESSFGEPVEFGSKMSFSIPLDEILNGKYKLIIEQFISEKKADQPLMIHGNWECEFEY